MKQTRFLSALACLLAASIPALALAQDKPRQQTAPREIRYCTNCATVEAVKVGPFAGEATKRYELVLRYTDGKVRSFRYDNDPGLRVGEKVKDDNGVVVRDVPARSLP
ncbi:MAG TPA: hypothetical protein VGD30_00750 [Telluria sp.]